MIAPEFMPPRSLQPDNDKRFSSRLLVTALRCRLGRVVDLSSGGMRVRGFPWPRLRRYRVMNLRLRGLSRPVEVRVEVAWVRPCGLLRREVGLAFTGLTEDAFVALRPLFRSASELNGRRVA